MLSLTGKGDYALDPVERQRRMDLGFDLLRGLVLRVFKQVLHGDASPFQAPVSGYGVSGALHVGQFAQSTPAGVWI